MAVKDKAAYFGKDLEAMSFAKNYHQWIIREFSPYIGEVVAEVGAGTGNFSELLLQLPVKRLLAFEPSDNMYPLLVERLRARPNTETINDYFVAAPQTFDSVVYVNVLEHIEDDTGQLALAYKTLKPGGHILIFVPALPALYGDLDRQLGHFRRYYKDDLVARVRNAGFQVVKAKYFDSLGIIPWYVAFVLLKRTISGGNVSLYDTIVVPLVSRLERVVPPPLGKNVLLVGRK